MQNLPEHLLTCFSTIHSLKFNMQHDHILKRLIFGIGSTCDSGLQNKIMFGMFLCMNANFLTLLCSSTGSKKILTHCEKMSDTIAVGKCKVHYTKCQYSFALKLPILIKSRAVTQVLMS